MDSLLNINFANQKQRKTFTILAVVLATLLLLWVILSGFYYTVYGLHQDRKQSAQSPVTMSVAKSSKNPNSLRNTVSSNLFGKKKKVVAKPKAKPKPKPVKVVKKAPETKLDLALKGLLSATNPTSARAIISVKKKPGKLYKVGEELAGAKGVTIEEIKTDGVLINRKGTIEKLTLVKKILDGKNNVFGVKTTKNSPQANTPPARQSANRRITTPRVNRRTQAGTSNIARRTPSGRRAVKAPNSQQFRGLDSYIEEEELRALEDLNAIDEFERP